MELPKEWQPTGIDIKSGWKNNTILLQEITTYVNEEIFVEDESHFMELLDHALEFIKSKYNITKK